VSLQRTVLVSGIDVPYGECAESNRVASITSQDAPAKLSLTCLPIHCGSGPIPIVRAALVIRSVQRMEYRFKAEEWKSLSRSRGESLPIDGSGGSRPR